MKRKLKITTLLVLLSVLSYSQSVLTDKSGDTLVAITIQQMDKIYVELLQKDSLMAQSEISRSKVLKYVQLLDSARKDINTLKVEVNTVNGEYKDLLSVTDKKDRKIKRNRKIAFYSILVAVVEAAIISVF
jgi:uncharacterized protein YlxW (UPF0749 family)|tara:strand:- start:2221 stop:2613 length:393 start_codon:yes stop_codon:yes gene_type:complete